jgi:hypothetical protein
MLPQKRIERRGPALLRPANYKINAHLLPQIDTDFHGFEKHEDAVAAFVLKRRIKYTGVWHKRLYDRHDKRQGLPSVIADNDKEFQSKSDRDKNEANLSTVSPEPRHIF